MIGIHTMMTINLITAETLGFGVAFETEALAIPEVTVEMDLAAEAELFRYRFGLRRVRAHPMGGSWADTLSEEDRQLARVLAVALALHLTSLKRELDGETHLAVLKKGMELHRMAVQYKASTNAAAIVTSALRSIDRDRGQQDLYERYMALMAARVVRDRLPPPIPREDFWSNKVGAGHSPAARFAIIFEKGLREGTPVLFEKCRSAIEAIYVDGGIRLTKGVKSATAATMRRTLTALDELRLLRKI